MSTAGFLMMTITMSLVTAITVYLVWRVLTAPQPNDDEE